MAQRPSAPPGVPEDAEARLQPETGLLGHSYGAAWEVAGLGSSLLPSAVGASGAVIPLCLAVALDGSTESAHGSCCSSWPIRGRTAPRNCCLDPVELIEKIALLIPPRVSYASLSWSARPARRGGRRSFRGATGAVDQGPPAAGRSEGTGPRAELSPGSLGFAE